MTADQCAICAKEVKFWSIGRCQHPVCYICSLRLRFLYKSTKCPMCKGEQNEIVLYPANQEQLETFQALKQRSSVINEAHSVYGTDPRLKDTVEKLQRLTCSYARCGQSFNSLTLLKRHLKSEHAMLLCDICIEHRKIFSHEYQLFSSNSVLNRHKESGESGLKGHPLCKFCQIRFYSDEELFEHCKMAHEKCHVCEGTGHRDTYYKNYESLEQHFKERHFICMEQTCLDQKFVVFPNEFELKRHQLSVHQRQIKGQRSQQRQAQMVDVSLYFPDVVRQAGDSTEPSGRNRFPRPTGNTRTEVPSSRPLLPEPSPSVSALSSQLQNAQVTEASSHKTRLVNQLREICKGFDAVFNTFQQLEFTPTSCQKFMKSVASRNEPDSLHKILNLFEELVECHKSKLFFSQAKTVFLKDLENFPSLLDKPFNEAPIPVSTAARPSSSKVRLQMPANPKPIRIDSKKIPTRWGDQKRPMSFSPAPDIFDSDAQVSRPITPELNKRTAGRTPTIEYKLGLPERKKTSDENHDFPSLPSNNSDSLISAGIANAEESSVEDSFTLGTPTSSFAAMAQQQPSDQKSETTSKKKNKKIVLFHLGL